MVEQVSLIAIAINWELAQIVHLGGCAALLINKSTHRPEYQHHLCWCGCPLRRRGKNAHWREHLQLPVANFVYWQTTVNRRRSQFSLMRTKWMPKLECNLNWCITRRCVWCWVASINHRLTVHRLVLVIILMLCPILAVHYSQLFKCRIWFDLTLVSSKVYLPAVSKSDSL